MIRLATTSVGLYSLFLNSLKCVPCELRAVSARLVRLLIRPTVTTEGSKDWKPVSMRRWERRHATFVDCSRCLALAMLRSAKTRRPVEQ